LVVFSTPRTSFLAPVLLLDKTFLVVFSTPRTVFLIPVLLLEIVFLTDFFNLRAPFLLLLRFLDAVRCLEAATKAPVATAGVNPKGNNEEAKAAVPALPVW